MPKPDPNVTPPILHHRRGLPTTSRAVRHPSSFSASLIGKLILCAAIFGTGLGEQLHAQAIGTGEVPMAGDKSQATTVESWEKASVFLFDDAHEDFAKAAKVSKGEEARANLLGEGVTLLTIQPRTQGNISRAQSIFEELIAGNPKDTIGLAARMHLARLFEFHVSPQDPQKAKEIYEPLLEDGIGDPLAELAASRLALIELYAADSPGEMNAIAQKLAVHGANLQTSIGRREFYSNLGLTLLQLRGDNKLAMDYLIAAEAEGLPMQQLDAPLLISIGALAEELGDVETARKYYSLFVSRYKRDARRYSVLEKLESLGATTEPNQAVTIPTPEADPVPETQPQS